MEPLPRENIPVAKVIMQGKSGAEFSPATLRLPVGTIVMWTNRTDEVQVFQLGRRVITLAPLGQDGVVGLTKVGTEGTTRHVLQSSPTAQVTLTVQASN